jgi:hypothetical protein
VPLKTRRLDGHLVIAWQEEVRFVIAGRVRLQLNRRICINVRNLDARASYSGGALIGDAPEDLPTSLLTLQQAPASKYTYGYPNYDKSIHCPSPQEKCDCFYGSLLYHTGGLSREVT